MNKFRLSVILILSVITAVIIQSCNKDTVSATAYTTKPLQADIDYVTWAPDTVNTTITYDAASQTKTFSCTGTKSQKRVVFSVTLNTASNTPGFTLGIYPIDGNAVKAQYYTQQLSNGSYVFLPTGTSDSGSGAIEVTAIDSVQKTITGTFHFYSRTTNGDGSVTTNVISSGEFTSLPYVFTSN
jgi:hypothetical protein